MQDKFVEELRTRRENRSGAEADEGRISDLSVRLLQWMTNAQPNDSTDAGVIAGRIEAGLRQLAGANAVAVLARRTPGDDLVLLATTNVAPEVLATESETVPFFPARHLLTELPSQPLSTAQAEPHLQVFLGELWDFTRESLSTLIGTEHSTEATSAPAWIVPLPVAQTEKGGEPALLGGVALLWMDSASTLSPPLRTALTAAAVQAGGWLSAALRLERLARSYHQFTTGVAEAVDSRVPQSGQRAQAVAYYSALIADAMGLPGREAERLEFAALLHGIGKIGVSGELLQKEEPLSSDEREAVRQALLAGAEWLREIEGMEEVADIVRHQGERYDGGGYPDGLRGEQIPIGARILAAALRFAAMTNARSDRRAMSVVGGGMQALQREAGAAFDPQVVEAFLRVMGRESEA